MPECFQVVILKLVTKLVLKNNRSPRIALCLLSYRMKAAHRMLEDIVPVATIFLTCYVF